MSHPAESSALKKISNYLDGIDKEDMTDSEKQIVKVLIAAGYMKEVDRSSELDWSAHRTSVRSWIEYRTT